MRLFLVLFLLFLALPAHAQFGGGVTVTGTITANDLAAFSSAWVIKDAGVAIGTSGGVISGVYLGTSASATNPQRNGDATTGLYSAAASTVSIATGGVLALTATSTQAVGIGTATLASNANLDIAGNGSANVYIRDYTNTSGTVKIAATGGQIYYENATSTSSGNGAQVNFTDMGAQDTWFTIGASGAITMPSIASSAAALDAVCWNASGGGLTHNGAGALCSASLEEYKDIVGSIPPYEALGMVMKLKPVWAKYKDSIKSISEHQVHAMFGAHQVESVDTRLATYDNGKLAGVHYAEMPAVNTAAIQALQTEIDQLRAQKGLPSLHCNALCKYREWIEGIGE